MFVQAGEIGALVRGRSGSIRLPDRFAEALEYDMKGRVPVAFSNRQTSKYFCDAGRLIHGELFSHRQMQTQVKKRVQFSRFRGVVAIDVRFPLIQKSMIFGV